MIILNKWTILGGDGRQIALLHLLREKGISVSAWGIGEESTETDWRNAVRDAEVILLPLPSSGDGVRIRSPFREGLGLRFSCLLETLSPNTLICGGRLPQIWVEQARQARLRVLDYFDSEALQLRNALPTVEGAILLALQALPVTLDGCEIAVLGYGRIASLLAEKLTALGAIVTVYARKERDLIHARLRHCQSVHLCGSDERSSLCGLSKSCRMVINTVPVPLITEPILQCWPKTCLLMELASLPGGFDIAAAERLGFARIMAAALPGKYFPETAGKILGETLIELVHAANTEDERN